MQYNVHEAKTQLSKLLEKVEQGEEVIIARNGKPVARVQAIEQPKPKERVFGMFDGQIWIADDFDEWTPDLEEMFYGGEISPPDEEKTVSKKEDK